MQLQRSVCACIHLKYWIKWGRAGASLIQSFSTLSECTNTITSNHIQIPLFFHPFLSLSLLSFHHCGPQLLVSPSWTRPQINSPACSVTMPLISLRPRACQRDRWRRGGTKESESAKKGVVRGWRVRGVWQEYKELIYLSWPSFFFLITVSLYSKSGCFLTSYTDPKKYLKV